MFHPAQLAVKLVEQAAAQKTFSGVAALLRTLAEDLGADGCVLFQLTPLKRGQRLRERELIATAQYFREHEKPVWRKLTMESRTGANVLRAAGAAGPPQAARVPVERLGSRVFEEDSRSPIAKELGLRSFVSLPVWLGSELYGAVNLCRCSEGELMEEAIEAFVAVAPMIPQLSVNIVNQAGFDLWRTVGELLKPGRRDSKMSKTLDQVAARVAETFNTFESSIYLVPSNGGDTIHLEGTQWPFREEHHQRSFRKGESLTGKVFETKEPNLVESLKIGDPTFDLEDVAGEHVKASVEGELPPLGWLAAPILDGVRNYGVLRTCMSRTGPYYFDKRHLEFLVLVAGQVGDWVGIRRREDRLRREAQWLESLVKGLTRLNQQVHDGWNMPAPQNYQKQLLVSAMSVAAEAIPEASNLSVRLVDPTGEFLEIAETLGEAWHSGSAKEIERRRKLRFPLKGKDTNTAGAWVHRERRTLWIPDLPKSEFISHSFPESRSMIVAPIIAGEEFFGTFDLRSERPAAFPDRAKNVAEMIGRQLGLYISLGRKIGELSAAKRRLSSSLNAQSMTFENLAHQLKTPMFLAMRRATRLAERVAGRPDLSAEVSALRGLCRRSEQIVKNVRFFAEIANDTKPTIVETTLDRELLVKSLEEAARDHALLLDPKRSIVFKVDAESFQVLDHVVAQADLGLLDQMVGNLLDNAAKYSFPKTEVRIRGGLARNGGYFYIGVSNRGVAVSPEEARTLADRGQRSDTVIWRKQEGSGIGLHLVEEILEAHKGHLEIVPTNSQGVTEFRLLFPVAGALAKV